ncbi:epoxide hydrolase family protein [Streptomyces sp. NPDC093707]|uniref:epoxide hydrolase family protein n=1 Tax=Streptomyces sp. NPDC093707 TaxID=3154984 RepID=UPI0034508F9B
MASEHRPFRIDIPEEDLMDLAERLDRTRWPDELPGAGWSYGVNSAWLRDLVGHWREGYDWRAHEAALNRHLQFTTEIDGQNIHFLHVRSPEPDATPLIITHGWPSTIADFQAILEPLTDPRAQGGDPADAFHVVAPSLPGYAFSGPTRERGWGVNRTARAWAQLMGDLGYERYAVQGGDFGSLIAPEVGRVAGQQVIGVHVNALAFAAWPMSPDELDILGEADRERALGHERWWYGRSGYMHEMSTRPQTIAYALNDSPVGQLAWNSEWFVDYDPTATKRTAIDRDAILANVSIYWLTRTAGSAARLYFEAGAELPAGRPSPSGVPTAVANFPGDHAIQDLAKRSHMITRWRECERGGHFPALQAPELLVADIREFFRSLPGTP